MTRRSLPHTYGLLAGLLGLITTAASRLSTQDEDFRVLWEFDARG